jgi:hypothetical protein
MARFCLATWKLNPPVDRPGLPAEPIAIQGAAAIAVEVIEDGEFFAVLFSTVDKIDHPEDLECRIGFVNGTKACSVWRDRGFPLVDATIELKGDSLHITTPHFAVEPGAMQYEEMFISIDGIRFQDGADPKATFHSNYNQNQEAPDAVRPATLVSRRGIQWRAERSSVAHSKLEPGAVKLAVTSCRSPNLRPLTTGVIDGVHMWSGTIALPQTHAALKTEVSQIERADAFGVPVFRFENIEVVGFRIDLGGSREVAKGLAKLIEPLNFHLKEEGAGYPVPDFSYRVANHTVLVELLRYGRMKLRSQDPPLTVLDYQSQHEFLVRVLVGRVDDDTAQARDAATYVPAIFVDNPWSKIIGRDLQGFAKCMANFSTEQSGKRVLLRPDGRTYRGGEEVPLTAVTRISSAERILGDLMIDDKTLLDIDLPPEVIGNDDGFQAIDPSLAMSRFALADTRWRQSDFDMVEFRRSFASDVLKQDLRGFRSVQVSPVKDRGLPKTWVFGAFSIDDDLQMDTPSRAATLNFHSPAGAPSGWQQFCDLLRSAGRPIGEPMGFEPGNWYRLKFSMGLTIDDGLDWTDV